MVILQPQKKNEVLCLDIYLKEKMIVSRILFSMSKQCAKPVCNLKYITFQISEWRFCYGTKNIA